MESNAKGGWGGLGGQEVHAYFINGPGHIDVRNIALRYWWLWKHLCSSTLDQKAHLIPRNRKITIPTPHSPLRLMLIMTQYFQWSFNKWSLSILEGEGGGSEKNGHYFPLNFIYGPIEQYQSGIHWKSSALLKTETCDLSIRRTFIM